MKYLTVIGLISAVNADNCGVDCMSQFGKCCMTMELKQLPPDGWPEGNKEWAQATDKIEGDAVVGSLFKSCADEDDQAWAAGAGSLPGRMTAE